MVDRVANVGIAGEDVTVLNTFPHRHVNIQGIDNHNITSILIATVGDLDHSQPDPVFIIIHQYAYHGKGKTMHSYMQIQWYKNDFNEKPRKVNGGEQHILTHEG